MQENDKVGLNKLSHLLKSFLSYMFLPIKHVFACDISEEKHCKKSYALRIFLNGKFRRRQECQMIKTSSALFDCKYR